MNGEVGGAYTTQSMVMSLWMDVRCFLCVCCGPCPYELYIVGSDDGPDTPTQFCTCYIHTLDNSDSLLPIIKAAQTTPAMESFLPRGKDECSFFEAHVNSSQLRELIAANSGEPSILEPDIVLVVGPLFTLAGCPPWHLKESEIFYVGLMECVSTNTLDSVLARYQSTVPRFGK